VFIDFGVCQCFWDADNRKFICRFPDGTEAHGIPHETEAYRQHAAEKSTGDIDLYCFQHDVAHCVVGLINGGVSKVLWNVAHGLPTDTPECVAEETAAQEFQKRFFLR
jgi:hypothetical protein